MKVSLKDQLMQTRGATFLLGHLIARSCANKAASACSPASLPPSPAIWHPPVAVQKYLKLFCSQSVTGLLLLMFSQPMLQRLSLCLTWRFTLVTCMFSCLQYHSTLFLLDFFFYNMFSATPLFCVCLFISTHNVSFLYLTISLSSVWFLTVTSHSYSHLTLTALFSLVFPSVTSVSQSQSCSSSAFPEEAIYKDYRVFFYTSISAAVRLYHAALWCLGAKFLWSAVEASCKGKGKFMCIWGMERRWIAFCVLSKPYAVVYCR